PGLRARRARAAAGGAGRHRCAGPAVPSGAVCGGSAGPVDARGRRVRRARARRDRGQPVSDLALEEVLQGEGLSASEARRKGALFEQADAALAAVSGGTGEPARRWFVPGRIEVLGKHTDYAGGRSLLCTAGRGFCVAAIPRADRIVRITDVARGLTAEV